MEDRLVERSDEFCGALTCEREADEFANRRNTVESNPEWKGIRLAHEEKTLAGNSRKIQRCFY